MSTLRLTLLVAACALLTLAGCAKPRAKAPVEMTSARTIRPAHEVDVGDDIRRACKIEEPQRTPKFDFDSSDLTPADRDVLAQVARCLIEGPLKGRHVDLVGRADPRGETEYNMGLGGERAATVDQYLTALGVDPDQLKTTSRGELDAKGLDEDGWQADRRVDLRLKAADGKSVSQLTRE